MNPLAFLRTVTPLGRAALGIALLLALVIAGLFIRNLLTGSAKVEAMLGTEQAGAAIQSGQDAASTIGQQSETEAARERSVSELQKEVDDAKTADDAHAAGADWLCLNFGVCSEE